MVVLASCVGLVVKYAWTLITLVIIAGAVVGDVGADDVRAIDYKFASGQPGQLWVLTCPGNAVVEVNVTVIPKAGTEVGSVRSRTFTSTNPPVNQRGWYDFKQFSWSGVDGTVQAGLDAAQPALWVIQAKTARGRFESLIIDHAATKSGWESQRDDPDVDEEREKVECS